MIGNVAATAIADPLEAVTKVLTTFGEVLKNNILPVVQNLLKVFESLGNLLKTVIPPLGLLGDGLKKLGSVLKDTVVSVAAGAAGIGRLLLNLIPQPVIDFVKKSAMAVWESIGSVGQAFGSLLGVAGVASLAVVGFGVALGSFVQKANPAVFQQFQLAMNDLMAVIGRALVPIFEGVVIPMIRMIGDALMELAPIGAVFASIFQALTPVFQMLMDVVAGALQLLGRALQAVAPFLIAFVRIISDMMRTVIGWIKEALAFLGIDVSDLGAKKGSSVGAAARQAQHMDPMEALKQAQRSAYSLGSASSDPMLDTTKSIAAKADLIVAAIEGFWIDVKKFMQAPIKVIWGALWGEGGPPKSTYEGLERLEKGTLDFLKRNVENPVKSGLKTAAGWVGLGDYIIGPD